MSTTKNTKKLRARRGGFCSRNDVSRRKLLEEYMSNSYGMSPFNAAIKAGYSQQFAKSLQESAAIKAMMGYTFADIAEQEGWTHRRSIRRMIEKAGHIEGINPAMRVISANVTQKNPSEELEMKEAHSTTKDFIEVPNEDLILKYETKLWELTGGMADGDEPNNLYPQKRFNLTINLNTGELPSQSTGKSVEVDADGQ